MRTQHLRPLMFALLAATTLAGASAARASINMYFRSGAPAEPRITTNFSALGQNMTLVPGTRVYYATAGTSDVYRYGRSYYVYDNGYWYRATSLARPFVFVRPQYVPASLRNVPRAYRTHWTVVERSSRWVPPGHGGTPPGQAKKRVSQESSRGRGGQGHRGSY